MTFPLRCTVRGCAGPLERDGNRLVCATGHAFDRAREGYWNLLQPQDRRSSAYGERAEATLARRRWLLRGHAHGLVARLLPRTGSAAGPAIDLGCGEGTLTAALFRDAAVPVCGIDLSRAAVRLAARLEPRFTWVVANADRTLPFPDGSIDLAVSLFGRRPADEISRVLRPGGTLLAVVPGPDDLVELREAVAGSRVLRERADLALDALSRRFTLRERSTWSAVVRHDRDALADALAMGYRGARRREHERLVGLETLDVTLSAEILELVCHNPPPR